MTSNILIDSHNLAERLRQAGDDWAEKHAAAGLLEDTKKSNLAKLTLEYEGTTQCSGVAAERRALADPRYTTHLEAIAKAKELAAKARVRYDTGNVYVDLERTNATTRRQEMKL